MLSKKFGTGKGDNNKILFLSGLTFTSIWHAAVQRPVILETADPTNKCEIEQKKNRYIFQISYESTYRKRQPIVLLAINTVMCVEHAVSIKE